MIRMQKLIKKAIWSVGITYMYVSVLSCVFLCNGNDFVLNDKLRPMVIALCPELLKCVDAGLVIANEYQSCCPRCSCEDSCVQTDSCCPGAGGDSSFHHVFSDAQMNVSSVAGVTFMTKTANVTTHPRAVCYYPGSRTDKNIAPYNIVTMCADRSSCVMSSSEVAELELPFDEMVVVHSRLDNTIYLNKKCAICNNATDLIYWDLLTKSFNIVDLTRDWPSKVYRQSNIFSSPPSGFKHMFQRCHDFVIDSCNVTGLWDIYDHNLQRLCEESNISLYGIDKDREYKNVYCFICNRPSREDLAKRCTYAREIHDRRYVRLLKEPLHLPMKPLHPRCDRHQIVMPTSGTCLQLHCPLGQQAYYGSCVKYPVQFDVAMVNLRFILEPAIPGDIDVPTNTNVTSKHEVPDDRDKPDTNIDVNLTDFTAINSTDVFRRIQLSMNLSNCVFHKGKLELYSNGKNQVITSLKDIHIMGHLFLITRNSCEHRDIVREINYWYVGTNDFSINIEIHSKNFKFKILYYENPLMGNVRHMFLYEHFQRSIMLDSYFDYNTDLFITYITGVSVTLRRPCECPFVVIPSSAYCDLTGQSQLKCSLTKHNTSIFTAIQILEDDSFNMSTHFRICVDDVLEFRSRLVTTEEQRPSPDGTIESGSPPRSDSPEGDSEATTRFSLVLFVSVLVTVLLLLCFMTLTRKGHGSSESH